MRSTRLNTGPICHRDLPSSAYRGDYVMSPAPKLCSFKLISTPRNIEYASDSVDMNDLQWDTCVQYHLSVDILPRYNKLLLWDLPTLKAGNMITISLPNQTIRDIGTSSNFNRSWVYSNISMPALVVGRRTGIGCDRGGLYDSIDSFRTFMMMLEFQYSGSRRRYWTFRL